MDSDEDYTPSRPSTPVATLASKRDRNQISPGRNNVQKKKRKSADNESITTKEKRNTEAYVKGICEMKPYQRVDIIVRVFRSLNRHRQHQIIGRSLNELLDGEKKALDDENDSYFKYAKKGGGFLDFTFMKGYEQIREVAPTHALLLFLMMSRREDAEKFANDIHTEEPNAVIKPFKVAFDEYCVAIPHPPFVAALCVMLNSRNARHTLLQRLLGAVLYSLDLQTTGNKLLEKIGFSVSDQTIRRDIHAIYSRVLSQLPKTFEPFKYQYVFDNMTKYYSVAEKRIDNQSKSNEYTVVALKEIIHDDISLDATPRQIPRQIRFAPELMSETSGNEYLESSQILPNNETRQFVTNWFYMFVLEKLAELRPAVKDWVKSIREDYNRYPYNDGKITATKWIPLPLMDENEGTITGTTEILREAVRCLHIPEGFNGEQLVVGDQATLKNIRGAVRQSRHNTESEINTRFNYFVEDPGDLHLRMAIVRTIATEFWGEEGDHTTLCNFARMLKRDITFKSIKSANSFNNLHNLIKDYAHAAIRSILTPLINNDRVRTKDGMYEIANERRKLRKKTEQCACASSQT